MKQTCDEKDFYFSDKIQNNTTKNLFIFFFFQNIFLFIFIITFFHKRILEYINKKHKTIFHFLQLFLFNIIL